MLFRPRRWAMIWCLVATSVLAGVPAMARDTAAGTKNFVPPRSVPDHFINEAEPFLGTRTSTRNEDLRPPAAFASRGGRHAVRHAGRHAVRHAGRHLVRHPVRHIAARRSHARGHPRHVHIAHRTTHHAVRPARARRHAAARVTRTASIHGERHR